ncbi:class I SAM-dependent methyltransferase [Methylobacter sp.]|uniref:class I SAM-dependent methyltransferase n=1 Tax=Methylobacter sp. TaxID=2051955 RepID=UPI002FDDEDE1
MKERKHQTIIDHYEACLSRHGDSHLGVDWPNKQDAEKRYAVMLDVIREHQAGVTLLDFGCGASHLYDFLQRSGRSGITYHGLDASPAFYELSRNKYPENAYYCLDVIAEPEKLAEFDYVVMNGVFTEKCALEFDEMFEYFKQVLAVVFSKVRCGLAFNVMSKAVDWERDDLFHLPLDALVVFLTKEISRHFVIRNDYGLYEYTVYVYKEPLYG